MTSPSAETAIPPISPGMISRPLAAVQRKTPVENPPTTTEPSALMPQAEGEEYAWGKPVMICTPSFEPQRNAKNPAESRPNPAANEPSAETARGVRAFACKGWPLQTWY